MAEDWVHVIDLSTESLVQVSSIDGQLQGH